MPPRDTLPVRLFPSSQAFGRWLAKNYAAAPGLWLQLAKKGVKGPTYAECLEEALRYGWIDSHKASHDDMYFLQRFTPRRPRSKWSKINRNKAEVLIAAGRMEVPGQAEVDKAKGDGRWDAAYDSPKTMTVPDDFLSALDAQPKAKRFFEGSSSANRFAILYRIADAKRAETREKRIAKFVAMCAKGETVH